MFCDLFQTFLVCVFANLIMYLLYTIYCKVCEFYQSVCCFQRKVNNTLHNINQIAENVESITHELSSTQTTSWIQTMFSYFSTVSSIASCILLGEMSSSIRCIKWDTSDILGSLYNIVSNQDRSESKSKSNIDSIPDFFDGPEKKTTKDYFTPDNIRMIYPVILPLLRKYFYNRPNGQLYEAVICNYFNIPYCPSPSPTPKTDDQTPQSPQSPVPIPMPFKVRNYESSDDSTESGNSNPFSDNANNVDGLVQTFRVDDNGNLVASSDADMNTLASKFVELLAAGQMNLNVQTKL